MCSQNDFRYILYLCGTSRSKKKKMNALGKESQFDGLNHDVHKLRKRSILHFTLNVKISKYFANLCRF